MTDSRKHLEAADSAMALVKTEEDLMAWHDRWMADDHYAGMSDDDAAELEALGCAKAGWFMGVMAG